MHKKCWIKKLNNKQWSVAKSILELQRLSYEVEARLISYDDIPTLKETIDDLKVCDEMFYGYRIKDALAGIISFKIIDNELDIHRLVVHPDFFRNGIATALLDFIEELHPSVKKIIVCTASANLAAVNLYLKCNYQKTKNIVVNERLMLSEFVKLKG